MIVVCEKCDEKLGTIHGDGVRFVLCAKCALPNRGTSCYVCGVFLEDGYAPYRWGVHPDCEAALKVGESSLICQHNKDLDEVDERKVLPAK